MTDPHLRVTATSAGTHALFAARVRHWPFDRMSKHVWSPWGSGLETDPQAQLLERQLRFISALHPGPVPNPQRCTVEVRYIYRPDADAVDCVLVGKAFAADPTDAEPRAKAAAQNLFEQLLVLLPVGYELQPAATAPEFDQWTGADLAQPDQDSALPWAEVRRPVEVLPRSSLPIIYPFGWQASGWETVWVAQTRLQQPSVVSVSLRPASLDLHDERRLADLVYHFEQVAAETPSPLTPQVAEFAGLYANYLSAARMVYSVRVVVKGPAALQSAVCAALSNMPTQARLNNEVNISDYPLNLGDEAVNIHASRKGRVNVGRDVVGRDNNTVTVHAADMDLGGTVAGRDISQHQHNYSLETRRFGLRLEVVCPATDDDREAVRTNFAQLEQQPWGKASRRDYDPFVEGSLRYLVDAAGALCAFRLPLLPADGLPGVQVGIEFTPPGGQSSAAASSSSPTPSPESA